ncbi:MAG: LLM class flavin-dependent oxidoreductase [Mycobacterium sp.]
MKYGFYTPNFDFCGDARILAELAAEAEQAGWDGFFIWDHLQFGEPTADPWIALTAMAMSTERIRLGPLVTPVPRRHIAKLAREVITLDHLSGGRIVLGVGAGYPLLPDYAAFGDGADAGTRSAKLDEGLEVLAALLSGSPVSHRGIHYQVECEAFQLPVQRPRVPIWVAATLGSTRPLDRAARWDGIVPTTTAGLDVTPGDLRWLDSYLSERRNAEGDFDIIRFGQTQGPSDDAAVRECAEAGATWWCEYIYTANTTLDDTRARIRQGPPRT